MAEQTLAIIKPDAISRRLTGPIIEMIESERFEIVRIKTLKLTKESASKFYDLHEGKPFFDSLVEFMSSGKIVVLVLESASAVDGWRRTIGDTDPKTAIPGTVRQRFGTSIDRNVVHGSDSEETAAREIDFFFGDDAPEWKHEYAFQSIESS